MSRQLIAEIISTFDLLQNELGLFRGSLASDDMPIWLPPSFNSKRQQAAKALSALWYNDLVENLPPSGLACCSKDTLNLAIRVNQAKSEFEKRVIELRDSSPQKKTKIGMLVNGALKDAKRCPEVQAGLQQAKLSRLNLQCAYKLIKKVPPDLRSISWTWARNHKQIETMTKSDAVSQAHDLLDPSVRDLALDLLSKISSNDKLAQVKYKTNPQLKANLVYGKVSELERKQIVTSNVLLIDAEKLPIIKWPREEPDERISRSDSKLDPSPYIKALNLHLYLNV